MTDINPIGKPSAEVRGSVPAVSQGGSHTGGKGNRHWLVLVGCCLLLGFAFTIPMLSFSVFLAPMADSFNSSMTEVSLYFTCCACAGVISSALGAHILKRSMRATVVVASFVMAAAYVLLATLPSVPMVWAVGIAVGLSFPLCTTVLAPIAINNWFAVRQGTFVGIVFAMIGVFGMILSPLFTALIAALGWQQALIVAAAMLFVVDVLVAVFLLRQHPAPMGLLPYAGKDGEEVPAPAQAAAPTQAPGTGSAQAQASAPAQATAAVQTPEPGQVSAQAPAPESGQVSAQAQAPAPAQAAQPATTKGGVGSFVRSPAFLLCAVVGIICGFFGDFNSQLNAASQKSGFDPVTAGFALSCASAGLMVGKILMGWVKDKKGSTFAIVMGCAFGVVAFSLAAAGLALVSVPLLYTGAFLSGFCTCLGTLSPSLLSSETFLPENYASAVGYITAFCSLGMGVGIPFYSVTYDLTGSYVPVVAASAVIPVLVAAASALAIRLGKRRIESMPTS